MPRPSLAVVIPAYNEAARIGPTLARVRDYFQSLPPDQTPARLQVLVVSDGSSDQTNKIVQDFSRENPQFTLLAYSPNRGKGCAVRTGMLTAQADYLLFSDADLAAPIEELEKLWQALNPSTEIAIGSRPLKESNLEVRQPWYRELLGRLFNKAVQLLAVKGIDDTQCGFKLFSQKAAQEVFSRCKLDGFGFDFESLLIARDLGYDIAEVPIRWAHQEGSKVVLLRDGPRMLRDLVRLRAWGKRKRLLPNPQPLPSRQ